MILRLGAGTCTAELPPREGDIHIDTAAETRPDEDVLVVEIEARIAPPAEAEAGGELHLSIDSIDLELLD